MYQFVRFEMQLKLAANSHGCFIFGEPFSTEFSGYKTACTLPQSIFRIYKYEFVLSFVAKCQPTSRLLASKRNQDNVIFEPRAPSTPPESRHTLLSSISRHPKRQRHRRSPKRIRHRYTAVIADTQSNEHIQIPTHFKNARHEPSRIHQPGWAIEVKFNFNDNNLKTYSYVVDLSVCGDQKISADILLV